MCYSQSGMDGANAGAPNPVRRRLKRRFPGADQLPGDRTAAQPRTCPPEPEPLARHVAASCTSSKDIAKPVDRPDDLAIEVWQPPVEPVQEEDPARLSPQALVRLLGALQPQDARHRRAYKVLWNRMYRQLCSIKASTVQSEAERAFAGCPGALVTQDRIALWLALHGGPDGTGQAFQYRGRRVGRPVSTVAGPTRAWLRERLIMLTWNGDWGVFTGKVSAAGTPDEVAARVREHADMKALLVDFRQFVRRQVEQLNVSVQWAFACEVSPSVLLSEGSVRVHTHLVLIQDGGNRMRGAIVIETPDDFSFRGCRPHFSSSVASRVHTRANTGMSLFYVLVPKIGGVFAESSVQLYHDVLVNPDWAFNLLQQEKITVASAREVIIRCAKNVPRLLANLDGYVRAKRSLCETKQLHDARTRVNGAFRPFKRLMRVEEWLALFEEQRDRYPFLVLEGPSRLGKTQYAEQLVPRGRCLSVDCSSATEPDLRQYASDEVDSIMFDEAKAAMVIRCKRLFQAPVGMVNLGLSATNCNAYQVMVHRKRLIVCSNTWSSEVSQLPTIDAAWLAANSVVISVTTQLWEQENDDVMLPLKSPRDTPVREAWAGHRTPACFM